MSTRSVLTNLSVLGVSWALGAALIRIGTTTSTQWLALNGGEVISAGAGIFLARKLDARVAMFLLSGAGVYGVAMFAVHNGIDARAVQGAPAHIGVLTAAFVGVAAGAALARKAEDPRVLS